MVFATTFFVAAVALASSALAHPHHGPHAKHLHKRAPIINQCNHGFSLTFDDGPYIHTSSMIDDIRNASGGQAKVTWYMNGKNFRCIYDRDMYDAVVKAYNNGHQIASHTWSHARLTEKTWAQIDEEVQRLDEAFVRIIGKKPRFLRPPYGAINQEIADYLATKHGKVTVTWDLDTGDTGGVNTANGVVDFYENLLNQAEAANVCPYPPHLTLSHDVQVWTAAATWESISMLYDGGYDLITTAQCLDQAAYVDVGTPQPYDPSWVNLCSGSWTPPSTPTCLRTYTSQPNDNCESIGAKHGMTASQVLAANPFLSCNDIWANTSICITTPANGGGSSSSSSTSSSATPGPSPPPCLRTYTAVQGDTCAKIGREFGMSEAEVKAANTFLDCANIWAWTPICITTAGPGVSSSSTSTASSSSSSAPPQPVCVRRYTSKQGDTCEGIAAAHKMTVNELRAANSFVNCADIWANTSFCITTAASTECVATYSSKPNDTCSSIESKFGLSANSIIANNAFLGCNDIWANTPICIPPVTSSCRRSIVTSGRQTCASVAAANQLDAAQIKAWNTFVGCDDIWSGTSLCVQH